MGAARISGRSLLESPRLADLVLGALPRDCAIVLAFHRVGDGLPPWHAGSTPRDLERIVTTFARAASPIRPGELGTAPLRGRRLALTFDDGFADNAEVAAPLLSRLGLPAAFFLSAGCVEEGIAPWPDRAYAQLQELPDDRLKRLAARLAPGFRTPDRLAAAHAVVHGLKLLDPSRRERLLAALPEAGIDAGAPMTWEQARVLAGLGFEIGSHGHTHAVLTTLDQPDLDFELRASRALIEERVGRPCDLLTYPDDRYDERVAAAAAAAGYRLAFGGGRRVNVDPLPVFGLQRLNGEDPRVAAVALRLRRRARADASFAGEVSHYVTGRAAEYGFQTQARLVRELLERTRPKSVLDAGCGAGALAPELEDAGVEEIVGVDAEPGMVDAARRSRPEHRWLRADVRRLPFADGRFDAAVCLGALEYVENPAAAVRELARVVRRGGRVLVSVPQRRSPNDLGFRVVEALGFGLRERSRPLTERELRQLALAAGLRPLTIRATNFFAFPFDALAPGASRGVAEKLDPAGGKAGLRRLGAQLVLEAEVEAPPAIAWLVPALPTGTTFLDRELAELQRLGVAVEPVAPRIDAGAARTFFRRPVSSIGWALRLQLLKAPRDRERGRLGYLALALKGMSLADRLERTGSRPHGTFADGVGTVAFCAAGLARVPFTFTAHSPYSLWQRSPLLRRQAEAAQRVFCIAGEIERRLGELAPRSRREIVRCLGPADPPASRKATAPFTMLAVGTPQPLKGFRTAIEAVALVAARGLDVRLTVVGAGPGLDELRALAGRLDLGERVSFPGSLSNHDVLDRLSSALVLLAPSEVQPDGDRDGLPVSILDAAACGVPSIATAVAGIPDFVVDGETGLIVPEREPEALAAAIGRLCEDTALACSLGSAARDRLTRDHDPKREVGKLAAAWFADDA